MPGGATRQTSVSLALDAVGEAYPIVLVHDAARSLAPVELIERVAAAVRGVMDRLSTGPGDAVPELTDRQRDVLRLIVEGRRMKEIAAALDLSTRTVETHKYEMMRVLGVGSTAELVRYAIEHRLVIR